MKILNQTIAILAILILVSCGRSVIENAKIDGELSLEVTYDRNFNSNGHAVFAQLKQDGRPLHPATWIGMSMEPNAKNQKINSVDDLIYVEYGSSTRRGTVCFIYSKSENVGWPRGSYTMNTEELYRMGNRLLSRLKSSTGIEYQLGEYGDD
jgi:hypothetical protein